MLQTGFIQNAHSDLITDAGYDFYGLRLATAGLDHRIKIWRQEESSGNWTVEDDWKAHSAAVTKLSWAHPEFGSVIASGSLDRSVKVWERATTTEQPATPAAGTSANTSAPANSASSGASGRWILRGTLVEAKGTVRAVEFSPPSFGLKLASLATDGHVRLYECVESPGTTSWQLVDELDMASTSASSSSSAANVTVNSTPTMGHISLDPSSAGGSIPTGSSAMLGLSGTNSGLPSGAQTPNPGHAPRPGVGAREADGGWALSWCKDRYWGEILAISSGVSDVVKIVQFPSALRPYVLLNLDPHPSRPPSTTALDPNAPAPSSFSTPTYSVTSVAWAPSCGRSYHLVATGSRDGHVRIWKLRPSPPDEEMNEMADGEDDRKWIAAIVADFDDHKSAVGRVEWNITGTILSSAGNDGRVRLWKATIGNVWRSAGNVSVEQTDVEDDAQQDDEMDGGDSQ